MSSRPLLKTLLFGQYTRKSTEGDERQARSLPDQINILTEIRVKEQLNTIVEFSEAKSAKKPGLRPQFTELLSMAERGEINAILCWSVNRLVRNRKEAGHLEQLVIDGVIQCIKTPEREFWCDDHALILAIETSSATQYSRDLSRDVRRTMNSKAAQGDWPYRAKLGYRFNTRTHCVEPDPDTFALIRAGWDLLDTGGFTAPQVASELAQRGLRVLSNRRYDGDVRVLKTPCRSSLYRLFHDPFYAGYFEHDGVLQRGNHEPMISLSQFERVQALLERNHHIQPQKLEFAYTGLITCGTCGCLITAEQKRKRYPSTGHVRSYTYYHCTGRKGCPRISVPESYIEDQLAGIMTGVRVRPGMAEWAAATLERDKATVRDSIESFATDQARRLQENRQTLDEVFAMRERGEITLDEFLARKQKYAVEINALSMAVDRRAGTRRAVIQRHQDKLRSIEQTREFFKSGSIRDKRVAVRRLASTYVLTLKATVPTLTVAVDPLYDLIRTFELKNHPVIQEDAGDSCFDNPIWRAFLDSIRTLIDNECEAQISSEGIPQPGNKPTSQHS